MTVIFYGTSHHYLEQMLESRGQILDTWLIFKTSISGPKRKSVGANKNIFINNEAAFWT